MLEILVNLRTTYDRQGDIVNHRGDIVVAKLSPAVWGREEERFFLITYLDDPELEKKIRDKQKARQDFTMPQTLPYKIVDDIFVKSVVSKGQTRDLYEKFIINRSAFRVNIDVAFKDKINDIDDKDKRLKIQKPDNSDFINKTDLIYDNEDRLKSNPARNRWLQRLKP